MRIFLLIISLSVFALSENINIFLLEKQKATSTITSNSVEDISTSVSYNSLKYYLDTPSSVYFIGLSDQPMQTVGHTTHLSFPVELKQEMQKLELAAAYKYYVNDLLYVGPALLYKKITFNTLKEMNINGTINSTSEDITDQDYSLYVVAGYQATQSSSLLFSLELKNDLLSSDYKKDYTSYQFNASILQWMTQNVQLYFKYTTLFKEKPSTFTYTGLKDTSGFSFGVGFQF